MTDETPDPPGVAMFRATRAEQRARDNTPCPRCGGDRLRPDFTGSGRCHAGGTR